MATTINADTSSGLILTSDTSGEIELQSGGSTKLTINSSGVVGAGLSWQSSIVTAATLTAVAGRGYWIDTTSNACTVTLPASASVGDEFVFVDYARNWQTNRVLIDSNGLKYQGDPDSFIVQYNKVGQAVHIIYSGATKGWIPVDDSQSSDATFDASYTVNFLVVAGGGSGGQGRAGGGGAGGFRTSTGSSGGGASAETALTFTGTNIYTASVGAGGIDGTGSAAYGNNGVNSVLSGSGVSITSIGGGTGGIYSGESKNTGIAGGSGGGSGDAGTGGAGTASQGFAGGSAPVGGNGTGGGGAGAVGASSSGGAGGVGVSNSITGSAVFYAGGGGGGGDDTAGAGGNGGGGAGGVGAGTAGTANTGGGGGGSRYDQYGGTGGSGVIILSFPTASYSGITTSSLSDQSIVNPVITTSGSNTILKFIGTGTYTA